MMHTFAEAVNPHHFLKQSCLKKPTLHMILQRNLLQLKTSKSHQNNVLAPAHSQESLQMT